MNTSTFKVVSSSDEKFKESIPVVKHESVDGVDLTEQSWSSMIQFVNPPAFDGVNQDVQEWSFNYYIACDINGWMDDFALEKLPCFLEDEAKIWWAANEGKTKGLSLAHVLDIMRHHWQTDQDKKPKSGEPLIDLKPYISDEPIYLTIDAGGDGITAIFTHDYFKDNVIRVASRALNVIEKKYSRSEKELLAIIFGITMGQDLLNDQFYLVTDCTWLSDILDQEDAQHPIRRWKAYFSSFHAYVRHEKIINRGTLSRYPLKQHEILECNGNDRNSRKLLDVPILHRGRDDDSVEGNRCRELRQVMEKQNIIVRNNGLFIDGAKVGKEVRMVTDFVKIVLTEFFPNVDVLIGCRHSHLAPIDSEKKIEIDGVYRSIGEFLSNSSPMYIPEINFEYSYPPRGAMVKSAFFIMFLPTPGSSLFKRSKAQGPRDYRDFGEASRGIKKSFLARYWKEISHNDDIRRDHNYAIRRPQVYTLVRRLDTPNSQKRSVRCIGPYEKVLCTTTQRKYAARSPSEGSLPSKSPFN